MTDTRAASSSAPDPAAADGPDVIDLLLGVQPGDRLDRIRRHRPQARAHAQQSYQALFAPALPVPGDVAAPDRHAVAAFVAGLHAEPASAAWYAARAALDSRPGVPAALAAAADAARGGTAGAPATADGSPHLQGPYGHYPAGPLSREDVAGPAYTVDAAHAAVLGPRLSAALAHAHLLTFHPRDAGPADLQKLLDAGWGVADTVILSQLVAFLAFQIRVVAGLRTLGRLPATTASHTTETAP